MSKPRVLVIAHGHPDFSAGGGEVAAHSLFKGYQAHPAVGDAFFLARFDRQPEEGTIRAHAPHEYLWRMRERDEMFLEGYNQFAILNTFKSFLETLKPDIVHLHHCVHLGYEILEIINSLRPRPKIYFTLHEFMPICANSGQMLKTDGRLCHRASPESCAACLPRWTVEQFWMRERRFRHFLGHVDQFISPSEFLKSRYVEWGLPAGKIHVIENGLRELPNLRPRSIRDGKGRNRFGFFGQINPYKGLLDLFKAIELMPNKDRRSLILEINGANLEQQKKDFQEEVEDYAEHFTREGVLRWLGPYDPSRMDSRMAGVDWLVVPSIWWENSPVTIQEAFAFGRPALVSGIGGMAEKVAHGVNGLHVAPRNPQAWADALLECAGNDELWENLRAGIRPPQTVAEAAEKHLKLMGVA